MLKVIAFPRNGIAYTDCLYAAAEKLGVTVVEGEWAGRWLANNVHSGDLVHMHWPSFSYYDVGSRWKTLGNLVRFFMLFALIKFRGGRVVWTAHNLYPHEGGRHKWTHRLVRHFITRCANTIFAHSQTAVKILTAEFGINEKNIVVVPHGNWIGYHPHTVSKAEARRKLGIPDDAYVYSFVGACRPYKNIEVLIDTFARLPGKCHLIIAGSFKSEKYRLHIQSLVDRQLDDRIQLHAKFIANDEIQVYVLAGDAMVLPYTDILTSGSAMLGLSFGVPVIVPNLGGMPELINDRCGLLYDAVSPDGLYRAMNDIRQTHYVSETIFDYANSFDWTRSATELAALLNR